MNYRELQERIPNYLKDVKIEKTERLMDVDGIMPNMWAYSDYALIKHVRMEYGRIDWQNITVKLDHRLLVMLEEADNKNAICGEQIDNLHVGQTIALLDNDDMTPWPLSGFTNGWGVCEVQSAESAMKAAADWFADCILESGDSMTQYFTMYFILGFHLMLMQGDMEDEERYSDENLNRVWKEAWINFFTKFANRSFKLVHDAEHACNFLNFNLDKNQVKNYLQERNKQSRLKGATLNKES